MPDIFIFISTPVSVLRFFCKNQWNKPNSPKTLVPNGTSRHERVKGKDEMLSVKRKGWPSQRRELGKGEDIMRNLE